MKRKQTMWRKIAAAAAAALVLFVLAEGGIRLWLVLSHSDTAYRLNSAYRRFQVSGFESLLNLHYPLSKTITQKVPMAPHPNRLDNQGRPIMYEGIPTLQMKYTTNSLGYRDHEFSPEQGDLYRIVCVGDSATFGDGVQMESTYPKVLEKLLNEAAGQPQQQGQRFQVINAGSQGLSSVVALFLIKHRIMALKPDMIVYMLCVNDDAPREMSDLEYLQKVIHRPAMVRFMDRFYVYLVLKRLLGGSGIMRDGAGKAQRGPSGQSPSTQGDDRQTASVQGGRKTSRRVTIETKKQNIAALIELCRARGIRLCIMTPSMTAFGRRDIVGPHVKAIEKMAAASGVPVIDLYSLIPKRERENGLVLEKGKHVQKLVRYRDGKREVLITGSPPSQGTIDPLIFQHIYHHGLSQTTVIDQLHPTVEGHRYIGELICKHLQEQKILR